jgi:hypothetical protein
VALALAISTTSSPSWLTKIFRLHQTSRQSSRVILRLATMQFTVALNRTLPAATKIRLMAASFEGSPVLLLAKSERSGGRTVPVARSRNPHHID